MESDLSISEELIASSIQTSGMFESGRRYFRSGRVIEALIDDGRIAGLVRGSVLRPYRIEIERHGKKLRSRCTCPVQSGCKHVAAVLFAVAARGGSSAQYQTPSRAPDARQPPPQFMVWLEEVKRADAADSASQAQAGGHEILYVVHPIPPGGKRPPGLLLGSSAGGVTVEPRLVTRDGSGKTKGAGRQAWPHDPQVSSIATFDDRAVLGMWLDSHYGSGAAIPASLHGGEMLRRLVLTGRAVWTSATGPRLSLGAPLPARLEWQWNEEGMARVMLAAPGFPGALLLTELDPPLAVDPATGVVRALEAECPDGAMRMLARLPPVPAEAMEEVWRQCRSVPVLAGLPAPDLRVEKREGIAPVPVARVMREKMKVGKPSLYGGNSTRMASLVVVRPSFRYGDVEAGLTGDHEITFRRDRTLVRIRRDHDAEEAARERLLECGLRPVEVFPELKPGAKQAADMLFDVSGEAGMMAFFIANDAPVLREEGWEVDIGADVPLRVASLDEGSLAMELGESGQDWFDLAVGARIDGKSVDLLPALRKFLAAHADLASGALASAASPDAKLPVLLSDGRVLLMDAGLLLPVLRALVMAAGDAPAGKPGRISRSDIGLLAALEETAGPVPWSGAEALRTLARNLTRLTFGAPAVPPPSFHATLRPYQQTGLSWLEALAGAGMGGLLADDMGLGKTVQTLAHIALRQHAEPDADPVLIVAPTSVLPNWQSEIARFLPGATTALLHGAQRHKARSGLEKGMIVLTSYALLHRDVEHLAAERFSLVIFDEAQMLKNPSTAGHKAAKALNARRKIALSGTPVENRLTDAWAVFDIICSGLLGSLPHFVRRFRTPIERHGEGEAAERLARTLKPFLLRRTKDLVATELPPKTVISVPVGFERVQTALYESQRLVMQERIRQEIERVGLNRAQIVILSALTRLRQICCDPRLVPGDGTKKSAGGKKKNDAGSSSAKLERLLELLDELIPEGRRIILFSQFTSMLDLIKRELDRRNVEWVELTGSTRDRRAPVLKFQEGKVPLILVSLKAGGTGLNLTAADTVILYDPWWNPAIEAQAIDRAHRLGQTRRVFVYRLIATGTIEEKMLALQERKADLAEALWSDDPATPARLDEKDIAFLLG